MTDRQTELLPCPFCGYLAKEDEPLHKRDYSRVICTNGECGVHISADDLDDDFEVAAKKWNTRATPDYVKPLVEALRSIAYRPLGGDTETYFCGVNMQNTAKQALLKLPEDLR